MRLFFERALPQELLHILFSGQRAVGLLAEFRLMAFLGSLHAANGDICAGDFIPPAIQSPPDRVFENRRLEAQVSQLFLPALRVPLLRFGHAQQDALAFFIRFALGKIAIRLRRLNFGSPIALDDFDCLLWSRPPCGGSELLVSPVTRSIFAFHHSQSAGVTAALICGSALSLNC
jgi:hypothetical protein